MGNISGRRHLLWWHKNSSRKKKEGITPVVELAVVVVVLAVVVVELTVVVVTVEVGMSIVKKCISVQCTRPANQRGRFLILFVFIVNSLQLQFCLARSLVCVWGYIHLHLYLKAKPS